MNRLGLSLLLLFTGPAAAQPPTGDVPFFEQKVRPLLIVRCYPCHSHQAGKHRGGLLLDSRPAILQGGDSGPAVVAGRPADSLLVRALRHYHPTIQMPPTGKLPAVDVAVLEEWVRRGAPFPEKDHPDKTLQTTGAATGRGFWSFQPLRESAPPPVRDPTWPR